MIKKAFRTPLKCNYFNSRIKCKECVDLTRSIYPMKLFDISYVSDNSDVTFKCIKKFTGKNCEFLIECKKQEKENEKIIGGVIVLSAVVTIASFFFI